MQAPSQRLPRLIELAQRAAREILSVYATDFTSTVKSDASPVTEAVLRADRVIRAGLQQAFPGVFIWSEESTSQAGTKVPDRFFLVDPLDGTKEFVQRRGEFTVNIAYVQDGLPLRGVVYAPAKARLFYTLPDGTAVEETGPFDKAAPGPVTRIRVSSPDNAALMVVASKSHRDQATDDYISRYAVRDAKSAGSSLKFCLVATGEADLYPRIDAPAGQAAGRPRRQADGRARGRARCAVEGGADHRRDRPCGRDGRLRTAWHRCADDACRSSVRHRPDRRGRTGRRTSG